MRKYVGYIILSSPFVALFISGAYVGGVLRALLAFASAAAIAGVIGLGVWLIASNPKT